MTLLVATTNQSKLREIGRVLDSTRYRLASLADVGSIAEPDETGTTFAENARLKAAYYDRAAGAARLGPLLTVAEDSGLEIDALDREPGVHSARFLGPTASYAERFAEINRRLGTVPSAARSARFVCAVAVVQHGTIVFETTGTIEGEIASAPRGDRGFGYDPIFYYPPYAATLAEVTGDMKLRVAHRGVAFRALAQWLASRGT